MRIDNPKSKCKMCGHKRLDHSIGGKSCLKCIKRGKANYRCMCDEYC